MRVDLTGKVVGRLTVLRVSDAPRTSRQKNKWVCQCECGNVVEISTSSLNSRRPTLSCGCLNTEVLQARAIDLIGLKFGMLTVVEAAAARPQHHGQKAWQCQCDCGNTCSVTSRELRQGRTKSCGCATYKMVADKLRTHGQAQSNLEHRHCTPEYNTWSGIKDRCYNPKCKEYKYYGARGIKMCDEWLNDFQAFFDYVGKKPGVGHEYSIDRYPNNDGNYEPGNVRWATASEQVHNRRQWDVEAATKKMLATRRARHGY